jgi:hypothetical protein
MYQGQFHREVGHHIVKHVAGGQKELFLVPLTGISEYYAIRKQGQVTTSRILVKI